MDASCDGKCHKDADEHNGLQRGTTINIQVAVLGGRTLSFQTHLSATVSDIKALIHEQLGCHPRVQKLILDTTVLADSSALLKDVAVNDRSLLSLILSDEPLGQSLLTEPDGKMMGLDRRGNPDEVLNEFQFMSLQEAWKSAEMCRWAIDWEIDPPWGNLGAWGIDLYWTTRSNKCRYEYWSTAPGDNECGVLIRIDAASVTCIGSGSDDGLCVFKSFCDDRVAMQLVREGWPRFERDEEAEARKQEAEQEAAKAVKAMKKLPFSAKKKAIKKLPLDVQMKVAMAMKAPASASTTTGASAIDATTGGGLFGAAPATVGGGLFGAPLATNGDGLFGAAPATTAGSIFGGGSFSGAGLLKTGSLFGEASATTDGRPFGAASITTGSGLFGDAVAGSNLFCAQATTGSDPCNASMASTGDDLGLFGASPATVADGIFGRGGLFGTTLVATDANIVGAAMASTNSGLSGAASATAGGALFGDAKTGGPFNLGGELATTGSSNFGAAVVDTGAGCCYSSPVETSSKQEDCKTQ
jgi:hypothetical protein